MPDRDLRKLSLQPDEPEPKEPEETEDDDEEEEEEEDDMDNNKDQPKTEAKGGTIPPFIPMVPHEDHVKVLKAEVEADEKNKFAANRLQIEQINATQERVTKALKEGNLMPIPYPEMDFSPNDKIREEGMKAQKALSDDSAKMKNLEATKKARADRDKVRQKAAQGGVAVE